MAGPLGARGHLRGAQPGRPAGRAGPGRRAPEEVRPRHVPVPLGHRAARRPPAGLHRHRRARPLQADDRAQRAARAGVRRVRPARRAVRRADRSAPADHHRGEHRDDASASCAGWGWRTTRGAASRPPTPSSTAGRSGSSCRSTTLVRRGRRSRARPIAELESLLATGERPVPAGRVPTSRPASWAELDAPARRRVVDAHRLAYLSHSPVNWCPGLGTVLANEEVTADGPQRPRQLPGLQARPAAVDDAHHRVRRPAAGATWTAWTGPSRSSCSSATGSAGPRARGSRFTSTAGAIDVFTTRPDTLFGATFMVLAPEHPMVDLLASGAWPATCHRSWTGGRARRRATRSRPTGGRRSCGPTWSARPRAGRRPASSPAATPPTPSPARPIPVFVADYVLMGYGTGAIMAVPGQDERDWEFATRFGLPIVRTVQPPEGWEGEAFAGEGPAINSANDAISLDGLPVDEAKASIIDWLEERGLRRAHGHLQAARLAVQPAALLGRAVPHRLRRGRAAATRCPTSMLPVELPEVDDYSPQTFAEDDVTSEPQPPLARKVDWVEVTLDLGDGPKHVPPRDQHDAAVGRLLLVRAALPGPDQRRALRRPRRRALLDGPAGRRPHRWRRPVRRRRRARGAAPAVRPVLAQGAVRPGPRVEQRAVPPAVQPGDDPGVRLHRRARRLRPGRGLVPGEDGHGRQFVFLRRRAGQPRVREDRQEPEEHGDARRDVRRVRRRHVPAVRDVDGPAGRVAAVGDPRGRRLAALPAAPVAQRRRRADRRSCGSSTRPPTRRRGGCCTARSTVSATTWTVCASTPPSRG